MNQNGNNPNNTPPRMRKPNFFIYIVVLFVIAGIWMFSSGILGGNKVEALTYSQFNDYFENNLIISMDSTPVQDNADHFLVTGKFQKNGETKEYKVVLRSTQLDEYIELTTTLYPNVTYEATTFDSNVVASYVTFG